MSRYHRQIGTRRWSEIAFEMKERDGWRCTKCGKVGRLEVHHVVGLADGGENVPDNLVTLCRGCHIAIHRPAPRGASTPAWDAMITELTHE